MLVLELQRELLGLLGEFWALLVIPRIEGLFGLIVQLVRFLDIDTYLLGFVDDGACEKYAVRDRLYALLPGLFRGLVGLACQLGHLGVVLGLKGCFCLLKGDFCIVYNRTQVTDLCNELFGFSELGLSHIHLQYLELAHHALHVFQGLARLVVILFWKMIPGLGQQGLGLAHIHTHPSKAQHPLQCRWNGEGHACLYKLLWGLVHHAQGLSALLQGGGKVLAAVRMLEVLEQVHWFVENRAYCLRIPHDFW